MNIPVSITIPCFHDVKTSTSPHLKNISTCKLVLSQEVHQRFHVIHLRTPANPNSVQPFESIQSHYTKDNYIDEIWETVTTTLPMGSLYSLDKMTDMEIILAVLEQMVTSLCEITNTGNYYTCLNNVKDASFFLQMIASFSINDAFEPIYIQTNRFFLKNINASMSAQVGKGKLSRQLELIPIIIKTLIFTSRRKNTAKSKDVAFKMLPCNNGQSPCTLADLQPRFLKIEDEALQRLHNLFCYNYKKLELFVNVIELFPNLQHLINTTISTITQLM